MIDSPGDHQDISQLTRNKHKRVPMRITYDSRTDLDDITEVSSKLE